MTWLGTIALGLGVLLVAVLAGYRIRRTVHRRAEALGVGISYADRLDIETGPDVPDAVNRTADDLIREHGAGAVIEAAKQVLPTLDEDDSRSRAVWRRVLESAEESRRKAEQRSEAAE